MRVHNLLIAMVVSAGLVDVTIAQRRTARRQAAEELASSADAKGSAKDSATSFTELASATLSSAADNSASATSTSATTTETASANKSNNDSNGKNGNNNNNATNEDVKANANGNNNTGGGNAANANDNNTGNNAANEVVNANAKGDNKAGDKNAANANDNNKTGNNNDNNKNNNNNNNNNGGAAADGTTLDPKAIQEGSQQDGQEGAGDPGQARSLTDKANFINFCVTQSSFKGALTNGKQVKSGSCNGIVMGDIPAFTQDTVVSSIMINPKPGEVIEADKTFDIQIKMNGMNTGSFTNPANTYYAAPQTLKGGKVVGHSHITCQNLGNSLAPEEPLDATTFDFFKGLNAAANGQGILSATVPKGLPAGNYRCCTMASSSNHQPVLMPVAQRGAQDDCTKFTASKNGAAPGNGDAKGGNNNNNDAGNTGGKQQGGNNNNSGDNSGNSGGDQQAGNNGGQANNGVDTSQNRRKGLRRPTRPDRKFAQQGTETSTATPQSTGIGSAQGLNDTVTAERVGRRRNGSRTRFAARDFIV